MAMPASTASLKTRAVREGDMTPESACDARYRLAERAAVVEPSHPELPIGLIELAVRAERLRPMKPTPDLPYSDLGV